MPTNKFIILHLSHRQTIHTMLKIVCFILFTIFCKVYLEPMVQNANNYGPFTLTFDEYGDCKGPKSKNLTIMTTSMDPQRFMGFIEFSFFADTKIEEIKVQVHHIKDNKRNFLWNYKLNEPCKHYAFAAMIQEQLKANNCNVKKGNYSSQINLGQVIHAFLGNSFFYGTYRFKADLTSKKGNIACFITTLTFKKKTLVQ